MILVLLYLKLEINMVSFYADDIVLYQSYRLSSSCFTPKPPKAAANSWTAPFADEQSKYPMELPTQSPTMELLLLREITIIKSTSHST